MIDYTPDLDTDTDETLVVRGMPDPEYRNAPGISQSGLKPFLRSIQHGGYQLTRDRAQTPAMHFGTAMHTLMLEGVAEFHKRYAVGGPQNPSTGKTYGRDTKAFAEWLKEQGGKQFVSPEEMERLIAMKEEIARGFAGDVLSTPGVMRELSIFWTERVRDAPIRCKARLDWFHPDIGIVDLKTAEDCRAQAFCRVMGDKGYHIQAAWYRRAVEAADLAERADYGWVVVESKPPHEVDLHKPDEWTWTCGLTAALRALHRYAEWSVGEIDRPRGFRRVKLPPWAWEAEKDIEKHLGGTE